MDIPEDIIFRGYIYPGSNQAAIYYATPFADFKKTVVSGILYLTALFQFDYDLWT